MKNSKIVTRTVIIIKTETGEYLNGFINGMWNMCSDFSENIKYADEFESIEIAQKALNSFNENEINKKMNAIVLTLKYDIDSAFLLEAFNLI